METHSDIKIKRVIPEISRFGEKLRKERRKNHFRLIIMLGLALIVILVIMIWATAI